MKTNWQKGKIKRGGIFVIKNKDEFELVEIGYNRQTRSWFIVDHPRYHCTENFTNDGTTEWIRLS